MPDERYKPCGAGECCFTEIEKLKQIADTVDRYLNADTPKEIADANFQMDVAYDDYIAWQDEMNFKKEAEE